MNYQTEIGIGDLVHIDKNCGKEDIRAVVSSVTFFASNDAPRYHVEWFCNGQIYGADLPVWRLTPVG